MKGQSSNNYKLTMYCKLSSRLFHENNHDLFSQIMIHCMKMNPYDAQETQSYNDTIVQLLSVFLVTVGVNYIAGMVGWDFQ